MQNKPIFSERMTAPDNESFQPSLSVVVPVLNEAKNILPLLDEIEAALRDIQFYEMIVVDDGSDDGSRTILVDTLRQRDRLRVLCHDRVFGQSAAIHSGVAAARAPLIVTLDGDGQNNPADIPKLLAAFERMAKTGVNGLIAGQRHRRKDPWLRRLASGVANGIRRLSLRDGVSDTGCSLKVFPRDVFLILPYFDGLHRFLPALIRRQGLPVHLIDVSHRPRKFGQTKYGIWNRIWIGLWDMIGVYWLIHRSQFPHNATDITADVKEPAVR